MSGARVPDKRRNWWEGLDPHAVAALMEALALAGVRERLRHLAEKNEQQNAEARYLLMKAENAMAKMLFAMAGWRGSDPAGRRERASLVAAAFGREAPVDHRDRPRLAPPAPLTTTTRTTTTTTSSSSGTTTATSSTSSG